MTPDTKGLCERFGKRLRSTREQAGLSQRGLATKAGLEQAFISRLENGSVEPCLGTLQALASAFELTVAALFKGL